MILYGNKQTFGIEIDDSKHEDQVRVVNIYVDNKNISSYDNLAYLPQFIASIQYTVEELKQKIDYCIYDEHFRGKNVPEAFEFLTKICERVNEGIYDDYLDQIPDHHSFMRWGPTTDACVSYLIPINSHELHIACSYWRESHEPEEEIGVVFGTKITPYELITILEKANEKLEQLSPKLN